MRNIKLTLEYDGSGFFGFQTQKKSWLPTIQDELELALERLLEEKVKINVAGRTDTGVHALGQVVNFTTNSSKDAATIKKALNAILHKNIVVREAKEVELAFHARFSAKYRYYNYYIFNSNDPVAIWRSYLYHVKKPLDIEKMREASIYLIGENDFSSFCCCVKEIQNPVRRIEYIKIYRGNENQNSENMIFTGTPKILDNIIIFEFKGNGFLRSMVKTIVATLIRVGRGKIPPLEVIKILSMRSPGLILTNVPSHALFLMKVEY